MTRAKVIHTPVVLDRLVERMDYAVLGPFDGRQPVHAAGPPLDSVCHVERDLGEGRLVGCTGFLIGPQVVLTAGHCAYSVTRRRGPLRIRISPGRDGPRRPHGAIWALRWHAHPRFIEHTDPRFDYGVIVLPRPFAGLRPGFRLSVLSSAELARARDHRLVRIAGYPSDKRRGEMWMHAERIDRISPRMMLYSVDTCPGHSGAPVWLGRLGKIGNVVAIHTRGPRPSVRGPWGCRPGAPMASPGHFNAGIRITDELRTAVSRAVAGEGPLRLIGRNA